MLEDVQKVFLLFRLKGEISDFNLLWRFLICSVPSGKAVPLKEMTLFSLFCQPHWLGLIESISSFTVKLHNFFYSNKLLIYKIDKLRYLNPKGI